MSHAHLRHLIAQAQDAAAKLPSNRAMAVVLTKLDEAELWLSRAPATPAERVALEHATVEQNRRKLESALMSEQIPASHRQLCLKQFKAMTEYSSVLIERMDTFTEEGAR